MDEKELTVKEESGAITGVDSTMEYSLDNGKTWQAVEGEQITGLIGDEIKVLIRYAETANTHASEPITVVMTAKEASAPKKPDAAYTAKIQLEKKLLATPMAEKITVQWGKVDGAVKYRVYAEYAGQNEYELVKTTTGTSGSFRKLHKAKIKTSKRIKLYVVAYGKNWKMLAKSETIYVAGVNSKEYTNAKTVKVIDARTKATVRKIELNVKGMRQIRGYATPMAKGKTILGGSNGFRYVSSNPYVAKVNSSGRITAVGIGSCNVYVYAKNGLSAKVKVVVK